MILSQIRILSILLSVTLLFLCSGCSCSSEEGEDSVPKKEKVSSKVKDWKAYNLGADHAKEIIAIAHDESELQDALLEVRARITNIETKLGAQSATDYERGFTEYIRTEKDSLARIIF